MRNEDLNYEVEDTKIFIIVFEKENELKFLLLLKLNLTLSSTTIAS